MPTWDKILAEINAFNPLAVVDSYIDKLFKLTNRTAIIYMSAFTIIKPPVPQPFHAIIDQDILGFMTCSKGTDKEKLDLIIHTPGGDYEATKRLINYFTEIFKEIRVFIPHMAMSGGTLISCASDEILMGPYSSLGPTDPQILLGGSYVPVNAITREIKQAFDEVSADPKKAILWNERLKQIPFGKLCAMENMIKNTENYLCELLKQKNCKSKNDDEIRKIAQYLNSDFAHSSHGKGICLAEAQKIGLNVADLSLNKDLEDCILSIYHSIMILFEKTSVQKVILNNHKAHYIINI